MENSKELNSELKATVLKRFEDLLKQIGPNRAQLSTKVSMAYHAFSKEFSKEKIDTKRSAVILQEVTKIEKMAAQQLPHHLKKAVGAPSPTAPVAEKKASKKTVTASEKKVASPKTAAKPAKKAAPKKK